MREGYFSSGAAGGAMLARRASSPTTMSESKNTTRPAAPRDAATVVVVRDTDAGMQVLLMRRVGRSNDRSSGAFVFPGGTLDPADRALHDCCAGLDDAAASARLSVAQGGLDYFVAAVRECFEEAGLLFAYDKAG